MNGRQVRAMCVALRRAAQATECRAMKCYADASWYDSRSRRAATLAAEVR